MKQLITFAQDLQASTAMEYNGHGLEKEKKYIQNDTVLYGELVSLSNSHILAQK